jgi:pyruvate dehydrogenase E1 component alpha subunit
MGKVQTKSAPSKEYGKETLEKFLREMVLIRRFEEKAGQMYGLRKIGGFCHLYIGQEAVAVGTVGALDLTRDYVVTGYRDHAHALVSGMSPDSVMAELYGKVTGCSKGKGGSMHMYDAGRHMLGGNGIVGSQIPVATGAAYKIRYRKEDGVVLCYFGDGAIHQGAFHESMNLAKIYNLPIIFVCENNHYGMGTDYRRVSAVLDFSVMGAAYDIPGRQVDGMDVIAVHREMSEAVEAVRRESKPMFFEMKTYRYRGHSMSDPAHYRTKEELEQYREQDPIIILKKHMVEAKMIDEEEYQKIDDEAKEISNRAADFADASEEPPLEALYDDVLA